METNVDIRALGNLPAPYHSLVKSQPYKGCQVQSYGWANVHTGAACTQFLINHYGTTPAWLPPGVLVTANPTNTGVEAEKREVQSTT